MNLYSTTLFQCVKSKIRFNKIKPSIQILKQSFCSKIQDMAETNNEEYFKYQVHTLNIYSCLQKFKNAFQQEIPETT